MALPFKKEDLYGKSIGPNVYFHKVCLNIISSQAKQWLLDQIALTDITDEQYNILKLNLKDESLSLLHYPKFFESEFPELATSYRIDTKTCAYSFRNYTDSSNPPILHRKELLLPQHYSDREKYIELTKQAETLGLFNQPKRIGFKSQWYALIHKKGYKLNNYKFEPL